MMAYSTILLAGVAVDAALLLAVLLRCRARRLARAYAALSVTFVLATLAHLGTSEGLLPPAWGAVTLWTYSAAHGLVPMFVACSVGYRPAALRLVSLGLLAIFPVAVLAAVIFSLPLLLNTADYQAFLVEQAEMQLGRKVSVKQASVEVFPYLRIALDDVVIKELDGTTQFLFADHFLIDLRIFPFLQRKVVVKRILLDKPKMAIRRGAAGILNISDMFSQGAQPSDFTTPMLGDEISISDGEFVFEDSFGADAARTVTLRHVTATIKKEGVQLGFKLYGAIPDESAETTFTVTGRVSRESLVGARPGGKSVGRVEARGVNLSRLATFLATRSSWLSRASGTATSSTRPHWEQIMW